MLKKNEIENLKPGDIIYYTNFTIDEFYSTVGILRCVVEDVRKSDSGKHYSIFYHYEDDTKQYVYSCHYAFGKGRKSCIYNDECFFADIENAKKYFDEERQNVIVRLKEDIAADEKIISETKNDISELTKNINLLSNYGN